MAIRTKRITGGNGINYSIELDGPSDWSAVGNNIFFKDLSDGLIYWKNLSGTIIAIYELAGLTGATNTYTTGTTVIGNTIYYDRTDSLSAFTTNIPSQYIQTTYSGLTGLTTTSSLTPGATYVFPYETIHEVVGAGQLNTTTPGYTPIIENLAVKASSVNTFFKEASSVENPEDKIMYDFTLNTVSGTTRPGLIYWRKDTENDIEAYFDVRNHIVARYGLNANDILYVSGDVDRGEMINDTASTGLWKMSVRDAANKDNFRLVEDVSAINQPLYFNDSVNLFLNTINYVASGVTYHEAIDGISNTSIKLGVGCTDILVNSSSNVTIGEDVTKVSIVDSDSVIIGKDSSNIVLMDNNTTVCGDGCSEIYSFSNNNGCVGNTIGNNSSKVLFMEESNYNDISKNNLNTFLHNTSYCQIGTDTASTMLIRVSNYTKIGSDCGGITLGSSIRNRFDSGCADIDIYSGGHNRFAQSCNVINLLGEQDAAYTGGTYYSPYSEMSYNTFGVGCSNITFDILGGRGNQFGDECRNLLFTNPDKSVYYPIPDNSYQTPNLQWRLVGTHWVRGIQNKTFQEVIHGCSFLVPCQEEAIITTNDWYSQVISFNTYNTSPSYVIELSDVRVADLSTFQLTIVTQPGGTGGTVSYLSGVNATKEEITTAMTEAINTHITLSGIVKAIQAGNRIYIKSILDTGILGGPRTITVYGGRYLDSPVPNYLPIWVTQKVDEPSSRDNRVYQEDLTGAYMSGGSGNHENQIHIDYAISGQGSGGFNEPGLTGNGAVNTDGEYITEMRIANNAAGKAFMFTRSGFPLAMTFQHSLNGQDPTFSLNR